MHRTISVALAAALLGASTVIGVSATPVAAQQAASSLPDPATPGDYEPAQFLYDEGPIVVTDDATGFSYPAELSGNVHHPAVGSGPFPLIVFQHGRHSTCDFTIAEFLGYPCPETPVTGEIPSYAGYDYLGELLASHGYVVVSVNANAINTFDSTGSRGMPERAQLLVETLDLVAGWNDGSIDTEPGLRLHGRVDLSSIGVMGHSRGGEGVNTLITENAALDEPYALTAVFALAAVDFNDPVTHGVHFAALAPICDGDVSNLQGNEAYDRSTYTDPASPHARVQFNVRGTNHNFFNTVWTNDDNGGNASTDPVCGIAVDGSERLEPVDQRKVGIATIATFLRRYVGGEVAFDPYMTGAAELPESLCPSDPGSLDSPVDCQDTIGVSYSGPASARTNLFEPTLAPGVSVTSGGFTTVAECNSNTSDDARPSCPDLNRSGNDQTTVVWDGPASLTLAFDAPADLTGTDVLTFRTALNDDDRNKVTPEARNTTDFIVTIETTSGTLSSPVSTLDRFALIDKRTNRNQETMNGVRIPLAATSIDLRSVRAVTFTFGTDGLPATGSIQLAEVAFQSEGGDTAPPPVVPEFPVGMAIPLAVLALVGAGAVVRRREV